MQFRVLGPDAGGPATPDLRRLFRGQRLTAARRNRLDQGGRILAIVATGWLLAAYERTDRGVRVYELVVDPDSASGTDENVGGLLDALELACLAGGARRLLLLPRAACAATLLRLRGYAAFGDGPAGPWFEKTFA